MTAKCKRCETEVDSADVFCRKCGASLEAGQLSAIVQQNLESFRREAKFVESEAIEGLSKRIEDTINRYIKMFAISVGLVVPILGFIGYGTYTEIKKNLMDHVDEASQEFTKSRVTIDSMNNVLKAKGAELNMQLNEVSVVLASIDGNKKKLESINAYQKNAQSLLANINDNEKKAFARYRRADSLSMGFNKIMNSVYEIVIQTNRVDGNADADIKTLVETLQSDGFKVANGNVLKGVAVDEREVLYYHRDSEDRALYIASMLSNKMKTNTKAYYIEDKEINPALILIKLAKD